MSRGSPASRDERDRGRRLPLPVLVDAYRRLGWALAIAGIGAGATLTVLAASERDAGVEIAAIAIVGALFTGLAFVTPLVVAEALSLLSLMYAAVRRLEDRLDAIESRLPGGGEDDNR